jgi:hypothetical protein
MASAISGSVSRTEAVKKVSLSLEGLGLGADITVSWRRGGTAGALLEEKAGI